jgi:hypothetical protein
MQTKSVPISFLSIAIGLLLLCTGLAYAASPPSADAAFTQAMEQYRQGKWSSAYGHFSELADHGHAEAARIALVMVRHGARMYGTNWGASQPQIKHWMRLASQRMDPLKSESGD